MNKVTLDGKTYVKVSVISRELGYTTDYVGQLCRAKKVDAHLIGRSWYVNESSLKGHKTTRYRSTKEKSKESLKEMVGSSNFYLHTNERANKVTQINYDTDEAELFPVVEKGDDVRYKIPVKLEGARGLSVHSKSQKYNFETPKPSKIKFHGTLEVTDLPETSEGDEVQEEVVKTPELAPEPKVAVGVRSDTHASVEKVHIANTQVRKNFKTRLRTTTLHIPVQEVETQSPSIIFTATMYALTILLGLWVCVIILTTQVDVQATSAVVSSRYSLQFNVLVDYFLTLNKFISSYFF